MKRIFLIILIFIFVALGVYSVFCYNEFLHHQGELRKCKILYGGKDNSVPVAIPSNETICYWQHDKSYFKIFFRNFGKTELGSV